MDKFKANPFNHSNKLIKNDDIINIMNKLNINDFKVNNISLYQAAFSHKSYCNMMDYDEFTNDNNLLPLRDKSYEEMEFLGDAILESVISKYLYDRYYKLYSQNEGFLSRLRTRIVCGENLARLSRELNFNKYLIISNHIEVNCDGRNNENILEDTFEAFLGAIFLDNNYDIVSNIIITIIEEFVDFTDFILNDNNYKDQIGKYCQHNFKKNPNYEHLRKDNDIFVCNLLINDIIMEGFGKSKKKAEQDASKKTLRYFNIIT